MERHEKESPPCLPPNVYNPSRALLLESSKGYENDRSGFGSMYGGLLIGRVYLQDATGGGGKSEHRIANCGE